MSNGPSLQPAVATGKSARNAQAVRQQLHGLEQQLRTVLCLSGISRVVTALFGGLILCGWLDWMLQLNDPGLRLLAGFALLAVVGWIFLRWLWKPLTEQRSGAQIASLLERRRPYLAGQLVSAAEFLEHRLDADQGSPLLQQVVVDQALARFDAIDIDSVIDRRDVRRQALFATLVCLAALIIVCCWPRESATAITRLMLPFRNTPWPKRVELQFVNHELKEWNDDRSEVRRVARGDTLELYVRNLKGNLPDDVVLEYRLGDEPALIREPMRKTILRDAQGHPLDVAGLNLPLLRGPILLRAAGGDDRDAAFYTIDVVLPPEITQLKIRLEPPKYSQRPAEDLPTGVGDIQALVGTRVMLSAEATQSLTQAALVFQNGARLPLAIGDDGRQLTAEFELNDPKVTGYRFEMTNADGFSAGERTPQYSIRLISDLPPQITLEDPAADVTATADAVLPLKAVLKDDLGLAQAALVYLIEESSEAKRNALRDYPQSDTDDRLTDSWSLGELQLEPGARVQFQLEATDRFDLGPPHIGRSASRTITIVGAEEKREELTNRLGELLSDLSDTNAVQRRIAEQTDQLQEKLKSADALEPHDADALRKLDLEQQRVLHQLLDAGVSVRAQAQQLRDEFEANHLPQEETTKRLDHLADTLTDLGDKALPELQQRLTQAQKQSGDASPQTTKRLAGELGELSELQDKTLEALDELEAGLSDWRDRRHLSQSLSSLIDTQQSLNRSTRAAAEQQLAGGDEDTSAADRKAELQKLGQRQRQQADAIEQFRKQIAEMAKSESSREPALAEELSQLEEALDRSGVSSQLRDAASSLADNQPGRAVQQQADGLAELEALEDLLENRPTDDQELLVKQMESLESDLETLQLKQEELVKDFQDAAEMPDGDERTAQLEKLEKQQEDLRRELAQIERQLERLQLQKPHDAAERAGEQMERLTKEKSAEERQAALQEALDDLEQARRELAEERKQAKEELAFEELLRLKDELAGLIERQTGVHLEVIRLDELRIQQGKLLRGQSRSLLQAGDVEQELGQKFFELSERMTSVEALSLTLSRISARMLTVAQQLHEKELDETVRARLVAIDESLSRLLAVLTEAEKSDPKAQKQEQQQPEQSEPQAAGPPGDVVTLIAQLELLRDLQAECVRQTEEFAERRGDRQELTEAEAEELKSIQSDQSRLTDLTRNLLMKLQQQSGEPQPMHPGGGF